MNTSRARRRILTVLALLWVLPVTGQMEEPLPAHSFIQLVAERDGRDPATLQVVDLRSHEFPLLGETVTRAKVLDTVSREVLGVTVDETGALVELDELRDGEREAHRARYGTLHPELFDKLRNLPDDARLTVGVWLHLGELSLPARPAVMNGAALLGDGSSEPEAKEAERVRGARSRSTGTRQPRPRHLEPEPEAVDTTPDENSPEWDYRAQASELLAAQMLVIQKPILDALRDLELPPTTISPIAPLIYVEAPKWVILELSRRSDVDTIYGPHVNRDSMDVAKPTQKGDWADAWAFDGTGIDVGILEDSRVQFTNPNLNAGVTRIPADPNVDTHATATAGMVASQHPTFQGVSQGVNLFSANATTYDDADISAAMDWAAFTQNLDVINNSWGGNFDTTTLNEHDRHLDYIVRALAITVPVAAGNEGTATGRVGSPGRGYNVITVGNYDDMDTLTWDDDGMRASSSFVDPSTQCEKPEVAASGSVINSTTMSSPWVGPVGSGTSFSAPMVSGLSAQIMESSGQTATPELTKAIIMATALHNIEGDPAMSEFDGAGGIDMRAGNVTGTNGPWLWDTFQAAEFPVPIVADLNAGQRCRVVICWDSNPNSGYTTDPLEADLDLLVYAPSGAYVTGSFSPFNSFEIVDFVAPEQGEYQFTIDDFAFAGTQEYVGFAVFPGVRGLTQYEPQVANQPNVIRYYRRATSGPFWNAVAVRPDGDYDLSLHSNSAFEDPADHDPLAASEIGGTSIELVVFDRNHAPAGTYQTEVYRFSGTGQFDIEHGARVADIGDGMMGPYTLTADQVVRVFDTFISDGVERFFNVVPQSGDADLALELFDSEPGDESSWYQYRFDAVAFTDAGTSGEEESLSHTAVEGDWHGFVILNEGATTDTEFVIYSDTSAPTGSVLINGGAPLTGAGRVFLDFSAEDLETDVSQYRIRNSGDPWGPWEPFDLNTRAWDLTPGAGTRVVEVQYQNWARMESAIFSDAIDTYACPQPAGALTNGDFSVSSGFPWCFNDDGLTGLAGYDSGEAVIIGGNDGSGAFSNTYIYQHFTTGSPFAHEISFDWFYLSANAPTFDGAFWDLIDESSGLSVVGGPVTLSETSGEGGVVVQSFVGSGDYELRLGTFSVDNVLGPGISTFDNVVVVSIPCDPVTGLTCTPVGGDVNLSWSPGSTYDSVLVERDGLNIATLGGSATSFTDSMPPGGDHDYAVIGVCAGGEFALPTACATTVTCDPVTGLTCSESGDDVDLSWSLGDGYESVSVLRDGVPLATLGGSAVAYTDAGAPAGSHTYSLVASCPLGVPTAAVDCSLTVACDPITGLSCGQTGLDVALSWSLDDPYTAIEVSRDGGVIASLGGGVTSYVDIGPVPGLHLYTVTPTCAGGVPSVDVSCNVVVDSCDAISRLSCMQVDENVDLTWTNNDGYDSIAVYRDGALLGVLAGTQTSYTDPLPPIGSHTYAVEGDCGSLGAAPVDDCAVDVVAVGCDPVTALSCSLVADDGLLSWTNGDSYDEIRVTRDGGLIATLGGGATSYTDPAVPAGTYTYGVEATCTGGQIAPGVVCVLDVPCDPVMGLSCSPAGPDVDLTWTNSDVYDAILILRDGASIATLPGSATAYSDTDAPAGPHTYTVVAECGAITVGVDCGLSVPCLDIVGLNCAESAGDVMLTWTPVGSYSAISVERDGALLVTLPGSATEYADLGVAPGSYLYTVVAECSVTESAPGITCAVTVASSLPEFVRGDCSADGSVGLADAVLVLNVLFSGAGPVLCADACDVNDSGDLGLVDGIQLLNALFTGGAPPAPPYPGCGMDPTPDTLDCDSSPGCL